MRTKAFTLIEVMVVMAIISVLAGIMMPAVWKFWESEETATTRQRLEDLRTAMVGERTLIQNGVRTNFGFVGDNGELPFGNMTGAGGLKYLGQKPESGYPQWDGPYMKGNFDITTYTVDAWGRMFVYTPVMSSNRYISAEIRSYGPNGLPNDSDDIVVLVGEQDTMPTSRLTGKIPFADHTSAYSARTEFTYPDPNDGGIRNASECRKIAKAQSMYTSIHFQKLPVGKITYKTSIYAAYNTNCNGAAVSTLESYYFINDSAKEMLVDFHP
ncbi:MAG: hypothetical protein A2X82_18015 [Geobacteraceae bacterium GWC2_55_20]|nr:MAG: hypothetical protein A2X82_18015 [Geobacteraceae bacterium GWC2_55_20]OGU26498.1 MAG: hypothetical protein A2X85_09630 [Geobacteraceae bacterium GWF2_54_21]HBA73102.1 hypothetical protein [Geobacter sp.]HCE67776.1 hypothetical protein [Geobacter sp.]